MTQADLPSDAPTLIVPEWPAPTNVGAFVTTRETGPSQSSEAGAFAAFNTRLNVGDNPASVARCRELLQLEVGDERPLLWLNQVHGTQVISQFDPAYLETPPEADAAVVFDKSYACVVETADCLPVFFSDRQGSRVGVAHAGWRSLAGGVLENTVAALDCDPREILAWFGPAISIAQFEVGQEVVDAFVEGHPEAASAFEKSPYRLGHHMGDLYRLAYLRLKKLGLPNISGGHFCTASDEKRFYSYRRDEGKTGRMASVIWLR